MVTRFFFYHQKHLGQTQREFQQKIHEREKELQELRKAVETFKVLDTRNIMKVSALKYHGSSVIVLLWQKGYKIIHYKYHLPGKKNPCRLFLSHLMVNVLNL